jgi:aryl-alcohol dehydrogenase-like predicted oxidoreductase
VIATKVAGPGSMPWLRGGPEALDASAIAEAIDASLSRLRCDYIDLYQLHWPDRYRTMAFLLLTGAHALTAHYCSASTLPEQPAPSLSSTWQKHEQHALRAHC